MGDSAPGQPGGSAPRRKPGRPGSAVLTPPTGVPVLADLGSIPAQRAPESLPDIDTRLPRDTRRPVTEPPPAPVERGPGTGRGEPCACGHPRSAHDHYRSGTDCGACGATECRRYRRAGGAFRMLMRRLGLLR